MHVAGLHLVKEIHDVDFGLLVPLYDDIPGRPQSVAIFIKLFTALVYKFL